MFKATFSKKSKLNIILLSLAVIISLASAFFIVRVGILLPILVIAIALLIALQIVFVYNPKSIVWAMVFYAFTLIFFDREIGHFSWGILQEGILLLGGLTLVFTASRYDWNLASNDFVLLMLIWLMISIYEVFNPAGASVEGWLQEIRAAALYPFLIVPISFLLLRTNKDLNIFFYLLLGLSLLATLNGMKQLYYHPFRGEQEFLDNGGFKTHILFGKLRVFSFYSDAGQFGASQAHIALIALILALGPFKAWKKIALFFIAGITFYGMLISGTRGALFGLVVGLFLALLLSKNFKAMMWGGIVMAMFLGGLKYTYIGNGIYQIARLRSAVDPQEASLNVRLVNQAILREYLASRPFGGGLGVIGTWGTLYNKDKFLSTVPPDSYWVKVWAMYGIVGFVIWICFMMYILGKCCGIVWRIENKGLKIKMIALTSGYAGILFCSYGNEVINTAPSSFIVYISWVFVFISPTLEKELKKNQISNT